MTATKNMTTGSEAANILWFALPMLAGNLLQQTYNIVDTLIVGKFLGDDALAAVGATGSITYLFYTLCIGLSIGAGIMISQFFGAGFIDRMKASIFNSAVITAIFGLVISVLSVILARNALQLLNVPAKLIDTSAAYMRIACGGTLAVAAYNWINSVMRALGDSKTPLMFLGVASVLNVGLDLLFVVVLKMGVSGAAWATVLAQGLSAASCIIYCFKFNSTVSLSRDNMKIEKALMMKCVRMGVPIAIQNGLVSVSMVALQSVTNSFGKTVMAAYTVSMRIEQFVQQPFSSLNAAGSNFTGQNIGAGKDKRAVKGLSAAVKASVIFSLAVLILFIFFSKYVVGWFVSGDKVISVGSKALIMTACFYPFLGTIHTVRGFLNGAGDTEYAIVNGAVEVICRVGFSLILTKISGIGFWGIWITTCLTWFFTALISFIRYKSGKWKVKGLQEREK